MKNITINKTEYAIAVVAPRERGKAYNAILPGVIRAIDLVEAPEPNKKSTFVFVHDGVTSGALGHVIEVVNKIQGSLATRGRTVKRRKMDLDVERHGWYSQHRWVDRVLQLELDLLLVLDDGEYAVAEYAKREAKKQGVATLVINIPKAEEKQRVVD